MGVSIGPEESHCTLRVALGRMAVGTRALELVRVRTVPPAEAYGVEAAEALHLDPGVVFKTLVAKLDGKSLAVGIVPVLATNLPFAAAADVLPVEPQTTVWAPAALALVMAMVMPRSLNEPVGLSPSNLR